MPRTALKDGIVKAIQVSMVQEFAHLVPGARDNGYPTAPGEMEQVTGFLLGQDGATITTDRSTYEVSVRRVGEDDD
jgi:hypothetical protein